MFFQKSTKANVTIESITILVVVFAMAILAVIGYNLFDEVNTDIQSNTEFSNESKTAMSSVYDRYDNIMDSAIVFVFLGLVLFAIISAFFIDTHPIFFIVSVILLIAVFVISISLGNVYTEIITDSQFSTLAADFVMTNWIFRHILELIIAVGFLLTIVLFVKLR